MNAPLRPRPAGGKGNRPPAAAPTPQAEGTAARTDARMRGHNTGILLALLVTALLALTLHTIAAGLTDCRSGLMEACPQ